MYGPAASDAAVVVLRSGKDGRRAGLINGTFLSVDDRTLYLGPLNAMFQEDRSDRPGIPARFRWEGDF